MVAHRRPLLLMAGFCCALAACSAGSSQATTKGTGGGATTSGGAGGGPSDDCTALCATEAKAGCSSFKAADCVAACEGSKAEVSWCTPSVTAAVDCLSMEPASSFGCDMNGQPAPKSGVCASQLSAMTSCWYDGPSGGLPDMTQACSTACGKEGALSCADPNCDADCLAGVKAGQKCNGAWAALVACAAKQDAQSFTCDMESPPRPTLKAGVCGFEQLLFSACFQQP